MLPALLFLLSGCAAIPDAVRELDAGASLIELSETAFFPQAEYQCGPAALTTVLTTSGVAAALDEITARVYLPGKLGSLQAEMLAATRTAGRLPYLIDGSLSAVWAELAAGRPVVVLQNLGVAAIPRWHYAVLVGIDADRDEVILRSGTDKRRITATTTFLRTWRRGDYWAMVVLRPDELPARVKQSRYFTAVAALEGALQLEEAAVAWSTALHRWPRNPVALFGLANVQLAQGDFAAAETLYRDLLLEDYRSPVVRNNLALALGYQRNYDAALGEIELALTQTSDAAVLAELRDTQATLRSMRAGSNE